MLAHGVHVILSATALSSNVVKERRDPPLVPLLVLHLGEQAVRTRAVQYLKSSREMSRPSSPRTSLTTCGFAPRSTLRVKSWCTRTNAACASMPICSAVLAYQLVVSSTSLGVFSLVSIELGLIWIPGIMNLGIHFSARLLCVGYGLQAP
jgi:hypothetical protein